MEESSAGGGGGGKWWWLAASVGQLGAAVAMHRRGSGDRLMPLKAFAVASLFVGASASASLSLLRSCHIYSVDDMKEVGTNMRKWVRNIPMAQSNKQEDATK